MKRRGPGSPLSLRIIARARATAGRRSGSARTVVAVRTPSASSRPATMWGRSSALTLERSGAPSGSHAHPGPPRAEPRIGMPSSHTLGVPGLGRAQETRAPDAVHPVRADALDTPNAPDGTSETLAQVETGPDVVASDAGSCACRRGPAQRPREPLAEPERADSRRASRLPQSSARPSRRGALRPRPAEPSRGRSRRARARPSPRTGAPARSGWRRPPGPCSRRSPAALRLRAPGEVSQPPHPSRGREATSPCGRRRGSVTSAPAVARCRCRPSASVPGRSGVSRRAVQPRCRGPRIPPAETAGSSRRRRHRGRTRSKAPSSWAWSGPAPAVSPTRRPSNGAILAAGGRRGLGNRASPGPPPAPAGAPGAVHGPKPYGAAPEGVNGNPR